jgi:hypothetical protein
MKKKVETVGSEVRGIAILLGAILGLAASMLQGCAVPALLGVKSYQSGDTKIEFITGVDFGIGMNGIDKVSNSRGIAPVDGIGARTKSDGPKY